MNRTNSSQKKKNILNYIYAAVIGLLVIACAVTISVVSSKKNNADDNVAEIESDIQEVVVSSTTFVAPMKNFTIAKDYSATELQYNDTLKQWEIHKAIDFLASEDVDVFAISDGTVSNVYSNYLEGTVVEISHSNGLISIYKSLTNATVNIGDKLSVGQKIGEVGANMAQELNSGAHLHLEMTLNGVKVDPNDYIDLGTK